MNGNTKPALSCFVLMPSGVGGEYHYHIYQANHVYEDIIKPAAVAAATRLKRKISVDRESDSSLSGGITKSILRKIASADIVIADVTGRNANVFLELGIRYSIAKKITILLNEHKVGTEVEVPFDIRTMRYVRYAPLTKHEAVEPLCSAIVDAVEAPLDHSDSLVYEFLPNLEVSLSGTPDKMPWTAYWEKITEIAKELKEAKESGDYHPDAVIGITNGGAAFADFLMQQIGYDCPVISLWNNRGSDRHFNSELNKATVLGLKRHINKRSEDEIRILVVDDIVGRAKTVRQASSFYYASY